MKSHILPGGDVRIYRSPKGKDRLPVPSFFRGELLNFGGCTWSMYTFLLQVFGDCRGVVYTLNWWQSISIENSLWNTDPVIPLKIELVVSNILYFQPQFGEMIQFDDIILFKWVVENHQLEMLSIACIPCFGKMWKHLAGSPIQVQIIEPMMASLNWCQFNEIHLQNQLNQCLGILAFRLVFNCVASLLAISPWLGGGWKIRLLAFVSAHPQLREFISDGWRETTNIDTSNNTKLPFWKKFLCTSIFAPFAVFWQVSYEICFQILFWNHYSSSRWWQLKYVIIFVLYYLREDYHFSLIFFKEGWFNQPPTGRFSYAFFPHHQLRYQVVYAAQCFTDAWLGIGVWLLLFRHLEQRAPGYI